MTPHFVIELAKRIAEKHNKVNGGFSLSNHIDMQWHHGIAERGYTDEPCVTGNWNDVTEYHIKGNRCRIHTECRKHADIGQACGAITETQRVVVSNLPSRLGTIFEKMGLDVHWSDEWTSCGDCGKVVRTSPDSMSWTPSYWEAGIANGELLCLDCAPEEETEEDEGTPDHDPNETDGE